MAAGRRLYRSVVDLVVHADVGRAGSRYELPYLPAAALDGIETAAALDGIEMAAALDGIETAAA
jgi:hypothetical protein